jgi:zinc protease
VNGDAALFAAVGDFETRELEQHVPPVTDQWNALSPYERIVRDPQAGSHGTFEIQVDDKPNATVMAGRLLDVQRGDAASLPLLVAAEVLGGGGLSSRLGTRIRQQAGLSYSVWAAVQLANYARTSPLTVQAIVAPSERSRLGQLIREEFSRWLDTGISPQELEKAKHSILEAEQRRRTDDGRVLRLLLESLDAGRDFSFYQNEEQCITNLSKEDVDEVSRQYLDPNDWMWIEAGDFR